jgi:hypothetical protein
LIDPARAVKPTDKPRVERAMPDVRDSFWRGREFGSLQAMRDEAVFWSMEVAGRRARRCLDGASPLSMFDTVETEALLPLPRNQFVLATWSTGKAGPACVEVIAALAEGGVLFKLRQAQGIPGLRDRHTPDWLEAACRKAIQRPTGDGGAAAFLHGPSLLFGDALITENPHEQTDCTTANATDDQARQPTR